MLKNYFLFTMLFFISTSFYGQTTAKDTVQKVAKIVTNQKNNSFNFTSDKPVLNQIAGAPKAFYTHYWEFGDGDYSTKSEPNHTYKEAGEYEVKLWATNNYDSGKTPTTRPQKVKTNDKADISLNEVQPIDDDITLKRNREPLPEEEFVVILSYKNEKDYVTSGKIYFYYNEKEFKNDNFKLIETRNYHNEIIEEISDNLVYTSDFDSKNYAFASAEKSSFETKKFNDTTERKNLPLSLDVAKQKFKKGKTITFSKLNPKEQRTVFFYLKNNARND